MSTGAMRSSRSDARSSHSDQSTYCCDALGRETLPSIGTRARRPALPRLGPFAKEDGEHVIDKTREANSLNRSMQTNSDHSIIPMNGPI